MPLTSSTSFHFDDPLVLDENLDAVSAIALTIPVFHRQRKLELKCAAVATHLIGQAVFAGRFKQSRARANFDRTTHHTSRMPAFCSSCPSWLISFQSTVLTMVSRGLLSIIRGA